MHLQAPRQPATNTANTAIVKAAETAEIEHQGCGWFDSSYELRRGLTVTEDIDLSEFQLLVAVAELLH